MKNKRTQHLKCWIENNVCHIPLSNGEIALCDEDRIDEVDKYVWHKHNQGYAYNSWYENKKRRKALFHKFLYSYNSKEKLIDHINGNKLDNRSCNLRFVNKSINALNSKSNCALSGTRGLYFSKIDNRWRARICINGEISSRYFKEKNDGQKWLEDFRNEIFQTINKEGFENV